MQAVFLAFSFRHEDDVLVRPAIQMVEVLLESHGIRAVNGEALAGGILTPSIKKKIEASDGLIAVITPDVKKQNGKFTAHTWARDELNHARSKNIPAVGLLHKDVENEGANAENEHVAWDPDDPVSAVLKLAQIVGQWKQEKGKSLKIQVIPEEVGIRTVRNGGQCFYRFVKNGIGTEWLATNVVGEVGGAFAHINGVQDESLVEVRIEIGKEKWYSRATPQYLHIEMAKEQS